MGDYPYPQDKGGHTEAAEAEQQNGRFVEDTHERLPPRIRAHCHKMLQDMRPPSTQTYRCRGTRKAVYLGSTAEDPPSSYSAN
jgi:hypothetical protein